MLISTSPWTGLDLRSDYLFLPLTFNWPSFSRSGPWFTLNYITVLLPIINFTRNKTNKIAAENEHDWQAGISFVILSQNNKGTDSWRFEIFQFNKLWSSIYNVKLSVHWRPHSSTLIQACTHWTLDICKLASDVVRGLVFIKILLALLLATYYHLNCPVLEILVRMGSLLHFNFDSRFASLYNKSKMKDKSSHYNHKYHHNINEECSVVREHETWHSCHTTDKIIIAEHTVIRQGLHGATQLYTLWRRMWSELSYYAFSGSKPIILLKVIG